MSGGLELLSKRKVGFVIVIILTLATLRYFFDAFEIDKQSVRDGVSALVSHSNTCICPTPSASLSTISNDHQPPNVNAPNSTSSSSSKQEHQSAPNLPPPPPPPPPHATIPSVSPTPRPSPNPADHDQREDAFSSIFRQNSWGSSESRSGSGSEISYTANVREFLGAILHILKPTSFLDSPCGDCNWQPSIVGLERMHYTGVDIVPDVIIQNGKKFNGKPNMRFINLDAASEDIPSGIYDIILCRDMIQHLPPQTGVEVFANFDRSGAKYLITSFHSLNYLPESGGNGDISPGSFYFVDPQKPPFNFSKPLMYRIDGPDNAVNGISNHKMVGLWKLPVLGQGDGVSTVLPMHSNARDENHIIVLDPSLERGLRELNLSYTLI